MSIEYDGIVERVWLKDKYVVELDSPGHEKIVARVDFVTKRNGLKVKKWDKVRVQLSLSDHTKGRIIKVY